MVRLNWSRFFFDVIGEHTAGSPQHDIRWTNLRPNGGKMLADTTILAQRYPPYCSKHNPIEHRLFPHVTRACEGVVFKNVPLVKKLIENTRTETGLRVTVDILDKIYETGRKAAEHLKSTLNILADAILPQWNYTIAPYCNNQFQEVVF
jgi:Rhodopirellula transposase DDE domain